MTVPGQPPTAPPPPSSSSPQILLLGLRRSGKSSLLQVLYNHLPPNDTLFLESTLKPYSVKLDLWGTCDVWDGISIASVLQNVGKGGDVAAGIANLKWKNVKSVIWVLDAQDDYFTSLASFHSLIVLAYAHNPSIQFHVFLHKMDGLSEDYRDDTQTDIEKRIDDNLSDASSSFAFAAGVKPQGGKQPTPAETGNLDWTDLERRASEGAPAAVAPPAAAAAASTSRPQPPGSPAPPNLETDVDLTIHQTSIFDSSVFVAFSRVLQPVIFSHAAMKSSLIRLVDSLVDVCQFERLFLVHLPTRTFLVNDSSPFDKVSFDVVCDYLGFLVDFSTLFANLKASDGASRQTPRRSYSSSTLRLNADTLIAFWQVDASLATIAILRSSDFDGTSALIDTNVNIFRTAIAALLSTHNGKVVERRQLQAESGPVESAATPSTEIQPTSA